jgi:hypothetical protein
MDKVGINNIKNSCASHMLLKIGTHHFKKKRKNRDTCHFYKLGWRRFLQPNLGENSVPI